MLMINELSCPGRGLQSIIDYFLVRSDQRRYVHDVRVIRGAEIESDHYLVLVKVNIAKQVPKKTEGRRSQLRRKDCRQWRVD